MSQQIGDTPTSGKILTGKRQVGVVIGGVDGTGAGEDGIEMKREQSIRKSPSIRRSKSLIPFKYGSTGEKRKDLPEIIEEDVGTEIIEKDEELSKTESTEDGLTVESLLETTT